MTTTHSVVRLDKVKAVYHGNIESIVNTGSDMDNGRVYFLGGLQAGSREVRIADVPSAASLATEPLVLHASPELTYLAGQVVTDFYVAQNTIGRAYHLETGDIITLTADCFTGTPTVGQFVVPQDASDKLAASVDGTWTSTGATPVTYKPRFVGEVIESTTLAGETAYAIYVRQN